MSDNCTQVSALCQRSKVSSCVCARRVLGSCDSELHLHYFHILSATLTVASAHRALSAIFSLSVIQQTGEEVDAGRWSPAFTGPFSVSGAQTFFSPASEALCLLMARGANSRQGRSGWAWANPQGFLGKAWKLLTDITSRFTAYFIHF